MPPLPPLPSSSVDTFETPGGVYCPGTQNCTSGYIRKPASLVYALSRVPRVAAVDDTVAET